MHYVDRVPEFTAAMRVVMMPGSNQQADVFRPIQTMGGYQQACHMFG